MSTTAVREVLVSLVWTRTVPECLAPPFGRLTSAGGYREAFTERHLSGAAVKLPWDLGRTRKWNHFWSLYLGKRSNARDLGPDTAWDYVVPLSWQHERQHAGPAGTSVDLEAWLYPHACVVIGTLAMKGSWTLSELPAAVAEVRKAKSYGSAPGGNRSLDGLASDLANDAARLVAPNGVEAGEVDLGKPLSIAAPVAGDGPVSDLAVGTPAVDSCIAGLAVLGPPGPPSADHFFDMNTDTNLASRIYWTSTGHVIWRADGIVADLGDEGVSCLQRNQTHALAQAVGLGSLVTWAGECLPGLTIDPAVHALVGRALFRLDRLGNGNSQATYRSAIVGKRVEPLRPSIEAVRQATGLGYTI